MLKVLVVEDEEMIRKGIVLAVDWAALDCVVVGEASNGLEALEAVERLDPSLIITDLKMPQMDGIEMLEKLRERGCGAYVIILTAYDSFEYAQSALRLGAVDFLLKPFHDGSLEQAVLIDIFHGLFSRIAPKEAEAFTAAYMGIVRKILNGNIVCKMLLDIGNHLLHHGSVVMGSLFKGKRVILLGKISQGFQPEPA